MGSHLMQRLNAFADAFPFPVMAAKQPCHIIPVRRSYITVYSQPSREERKNAPFWLKSVACVSIFFLYSVPYHR